ncbi:translation initiation factor IF-2 [Phormidesmis priestleyi ULC007]|uniref:Translation initiation factor IF-2 n=1 Tax=Phormidesmis priestleyi ULC007 TaxID=1920490 RepID=A0A2T1DD59_9CYAN|nr:translation initiation factor IF-2 [Phormidesmis priestleyi]PSB18371.1 translation initiation factor IF-2 [Phormidesmis priestleyi ULC007]PZO46246.1 MAG: translation initiation factor IF-2 [Phormidesmis priestleyi]
MNNAKVRIYELSRELNLDNRDLLAICEQLNISVKSHSSTITEDEAERIRAAAAKYTASHPPSTKSNPTRQSANSQPAEIRKKTPLNIQKKQQILEIRRPITRSASEPQPELKAPPTPQPTATQTHQAPANPAESNRPTHLESEELKPETSDAPIAPTESFADPAADISPAPVEAPQPEPPAATQKPSVSIAIELVEEKPLSQPPARPAATSSRPSTATKPVLKRDKAAQPAPSATEAPRRELGAAPQREGSRPQGGSPGEGVRRPVPGGRPGEDRSTPRPQTIVELRRPKPVQSPQDFAVQGDGAATAGLVLRVNRPTRPTADAPVAPGPLDLQLNKPTPPKPKRAKGWDDEEEEVQEFPSDKAKLAAKGKRRVQPKIDEDDDDDLDNLSGGGIVDAAQMSISLARPAKPKGLPGQIRVAAAPTPAAPQRKKSGGTRDRRDRRDQEVKVERPETITLTGGLTVQDLAQRLAVPATDLITKLFMKGIAATITQTLDIGTATMVAEEYNVEVEAGEKQEAARKVTEMVGAEDLEYLIRRPPVVTIMGHVDHGKTTLLDSIRKTKVAQGEAGGITQHIGAYHVDVEHNGQEQQVVFLDTPGHEAFTAMRARGARVTDIAILVVAADDGVQPQTIEAISHAKAAGVPIVVAINKVDKEGAQPDRVKQELTEYALVPEEWGGDTIMVPVSAINGDNLDTLLEMILLVAEVEDLSANPDRSARGTVIEAHLDKAKGPVATLLIQNGTLHVGDILVAGSSLGKVRAMVDDRGKRVQVASPSFAVEVLGLSDVPSAGDEFEVFQDEREARAVSDARADDQRQSRLLAAVSSRRVSLNTLSAKAQEGDLKELNLVLKADVQGSLEAILGSLRQLPQKEVQVRVLFAAPGEISETDVDLAAASDAVVIGFNTTLAPGARQAADRAGVDVRDYNIIYKLLDDVQGAMEGLLDPEMIEEPLGQVEVRAVFPVGRGAVAGCYVLSGKIVRNCKIRIRRGNNLVHEGNLDSLKRMKEDAREVNAGYECGIGLDNFSAWQIGDIIEAYRMISKRRTLAK